jgi:hypothetical protein
MGQKKRKPSWSSNGDYDEELGDSIWVNNPLMDAFFDYINSPEGELHLEADEFIWDYLQDVRVDAEKRLFLWADDEIFDAEKPLDIDQTVERIQRRYPVYPREIIVRSVLGWLECGYAPPDYSQAQMAKLDGLTERWVEDYERSLSSANPAKQVSP